MCLDIHELEQFIGQLASLINVSATIQVITCAIRVKHEAGFEGRKQTFNQTTVVVFSVQVNRSKKPNTK